MTPGVQFDKVQDVLQKNLDHLQALGGKVMSFATDLNPQALDCTMETARLNNVEIQAVRTDLETGLDHLKVFFSLHYELNNTEF